MMGWAGSSPPSAGSPLQPRRPDQSWLAEVGFAAVEPVQTESAALVYCAPGSVLKIHRPGTDPVLLAQRLEAAAGAAEFVSPLSLEPLPVPTNVGAEERTDRWATLWPLVEVLSPATVPELLPWRAAGSLLARLHARPAATAPDNGSVSRVGRCLDFLETCPASEARVILELAGRLPDPAVVFGGKALVHGDWHLGQLGRPVDGGWLLLDPDDLGSGDPAADFARPAGLWAAGLLGESEWREFLDGYASISAGGGLVPRWSRLDASARWGVVMLATALLRRAADLSRPDREMLTRFTKMSHRMLAEASPRLEP